MLGSQKIFGIDELSTYGIMGHKSGKFWDIITNAMCLYIAPQDQGNHKPCHIVEYP